VSLVYLGSGSRWRSAVTLSTNRTFEVYSQERREQDRDADVKGLLAIKVNGALLRHKISYTDQRLIVITYRTL